MTGIGWGLLILPIHISCYPMTNPVIIPKNDSVPRSRTSFKMGSTSDPYSTSQMVDLLECNIKRMMEYDDGGECLYILSEAEQHDVTFIDRLTAACVKLGYIVFPLEELSSSQCLGVEQQPILSTARIIRKPSNGSFIEIRAAVVGNVDAGKSTILGVLTRQMLDDGRGRARTSLFRHKHEIETGRTSSVGNEILGFDASGRVVDAVDPRGKKREWSEICASSSKLVSFMDLAGHEKYLKTTMFGLTGYAPDYAMLIMGSNAGLVGMAKEHLALTFALHVPVMIIVTKIDMTPPNILEENMNSLFRLLKSPNCQRVPILIKSTKDALAIVKNFLCDRYCPVFQVSSVTGLGIPLLVQFLNLVPTRSAALASLSTLFNNQGISSNPTRSQDASNFVEYFITETYEVHGVGTVVSGTLQSGTVLPGQILYLGPDSNGAFIQTQIRSIQRRKLNTSVATAGQSVTFSLKKIKKNQIKKGMVLVSKEPVGSHRDSRLSGELAAQDVAVCRVFSAEVLILFHATTISLQYQAMLHCGVIRQTVTLVNIEQVIRSAASDAEASGSTGKDRKHILRTGDRAIVRFRFIHKPEYMKIGSRLLFREGRTKGVGRVIRLYPEEN